MKTTCFLRMVMVVALGCGMVTLLQPQQTLAQMERACRENGPPRLASSNGPSQGCPKDYRVGAEDLLEVQFFGQEDLNRQVRVDGEGEVTLPLVGAVKVAGYSPKAIERRLMDAYGARYLRTPQINLAVKEYRHQRVSVTGAVDKPGYYEIIGPRKLLEILAMAGGLQDKGADSKAGDMVRIIREQGTPQTLVIDLKRLQAQGDTDLNVTIHGGDVVHVPFAGNAYVLGGVRMPGSVAVRDNLTLSQALAMAGGADPVLATNQALNRDMMIAFCISLFFRALSELRLRERMHSGGLWVTILCSLSYMALLRAPLIILGGLALFAYVMARPGVARKRTWLYRTVRFSFIVLVLFLGSASFFLFGKYYTAQSQLENEATQFCEVGNMNQRLRISEDAGSAYMKGVNYSSYQDVVKVMPLATFYFMFSPLPWQVTSPKQALGVFDCTWMLLVCWYFLKGIKSLYRSNRKLTLALLTFLMVGFTTSSVLQANAGSAMRHRTMFSFLMFPIAVHGMARRQLLRSTLRMRIPACAPNRRTKRCG